MVEETGLENRQGMRVPREFKSLSFCQKGKTMLENINEVELLTEEELKEIKKVLNDLFTNHAWLMEELGK